MRLFAAVDVPQDRLDSVEAAVDLMSPRLPDARWTARAGWHVTVKFFGEVADDAVGELRGALSRAAAGAVPVESRLTELGAFPTPRRARVLWAGIEDPGGLEQLCGEISRLSGFPAEQRAFRPHLTLARFRRPAPVGEVLSEAPSLDGSKFSIDSVTLFRSNLSRAGARYEALGEYDFSAGSFL